jgi:hypothetical protein
MHSGLLGTRRATSTAVDGFAGNMDVVREESGPTDTGCAPGPLPTGDLQGYGTTECRSGEFTQVEGYSRRRRSAALIHFCRPSGPRTRPNHSRRSRTHQSSVPPGDHVADSTDIGGLTSWRFSGLSRSRSTFITD